MTNSLKSNEFMQIAIEEALKNKNEIPIGAVIVKNGEVIAKAHNLKETKKDVSAHAEILAIREASQKLNNWRLEECEMFVTLEPCPMCATAIINSRMKAVYFGAYDNLYGAFGSKIELKSIFNSDIKWTGGVEEEACSKIIKDFFRGKNDTKENT